MPSEMACINSCVLGQDPVISFLNYILIAAIAFSAIALIFFHKKLSIKWNLILKSTLLTAIFAFLIVLSYSSENHPLGFFNAAHTIALFLALAFFVTSYKTAASFLPHVRSISSSFLFFIIIIYKPKAFTMSA